MGKNELDRPLAGPVPREFCEQAPASVPVLISTGGNHTELHVTAAVEVDCDSLQEVGSRLGEVAEAMAGHGHYNDTMHVSLVVTYT